LGLRLAAVDQSANLRQKNHLSAFGRTCSVRIEVTKPSRCGNLEINRECLVKISKQMAAKSKMNLNVGWVEQ